MKLNKLTKEQTLQHSKRDYNPPVWEKEVHRYDKYTDVEYYECPSGDGYDYDRLFVVYSLPDGLRVFNHLSYSASLTNAGFVKVYITNEGEVITTKFQGLDGKEGRAENCDANRKIFSRLSQQYGIIFTTIL